VVGFIGIRTVLELFEIDRIGGNNCWWFVLFWRDYKDPITHGGMGRGDDHDKTQYPAAFKKRYDSE
jgi:hypothetical protein